MPSSNPDLHLVPSPALTASPTTTIAILGNQYSEQGFGLRLIDPSADSCWLHDWLHRDYARFWGLGQASPDEIFTFYQAIQKSSHSRAYLGSYGLQPAFLLEHYLPAQDELGRHYAVRDGDHGMHFALAPVQKPRHNFSIEVLLAIIEIIFRDTTARRIVVEPDIRNIKIHPLNFKAGFRYHALLTLKAKSAYLGFCSRNQFAAARHRYRNQCP